VAGYAGHGRPKAFHVVIRRLDYTFKRTRKRGKSRRKDEGGNIVSIDESGFDQRPSPAYGYSMAGEPAIVEWKPSSDRTRLNLLLAVHASGVCTSIVQDRPFKGSGFAEFIRSLPHEPGTSLLLDNASIHKTSAVKLAIEEKGFSAIYTPPYTPEFNPIELVFGIIKNAFYKLRYSDTFDDLRTAVDQCIRENSKASTVRNCFKHVDGLVLQEATRRARV